MASRLPNRLSDGFTSLEGGVNSGRSPDIINQNQCAWAENVRFRGGYADQRPGFKSVNFLEKVKSSSEGYPGTLHTTFSTLFFQGSEFYDNGSASGQFIAVASGRVFSLTPTNSTTWRINEMTDGTALLDPKVSAVFFQQCDRFMVIQDGVNPPVIIEASEIRQAVAQDKEVPIGSGPMAYGLGRLWVAQGRNFVAGDIVGGDTGVLKFTENDYLNEGGAFSVPTAAGPITGMTFTSTLDTSLGQGELLVFTQSSVFSVTVPIDRDEWKNLNYPAQRITIANAGGVSHRTIVNINSDTFFQSKDGLRSVIQGQRQYGVWANTPLSKEVNRAIERDSHLFQPLSSAINHNNRMLFLVGGKAQQWPSVDRFVVDDEGNRVVDENGDYLVVYATANDVSTVHQPASFESIVSLDFDPVSSFGQTQAQPAYDGVWNKAGYRMLQLVSGRFFGQDRGFVWAVKESDRTVELLEITKDDSFDRDTANAETSITSSIESRAYNFGRNREIKRLDSGDIWMDKVAGSVSFDLDFRPDQYPCWFDWIAFSESAKDRQCDADISQCSWVTYQPQYRPRVRIPQPAPTDEAGAVKPSIMGYEFQAKLSWTGKARIKALRLNALLTPEDVYGEAPTASPTEQSITCCP